jgi:hypothetical protein
MLERIQGYFAKLEGLTIEELDLAVEKLARAEKGNLAHVIAHLAEMARRKGALERGYKNTFDYCVRRLNLSEGSVALRLQVANVSRRFPQILIALAENRLSLTVAGLVAPHLTEENVETLLAECEGMSKRAAEEYLARLRPKPVFAPSIRKAPSAPPPAQPEPPASSNMEEPSATTTGAETSRTPSPPLPPRRRSPSVLQPATPEQFNFRFSAGRKFKEKLDRLAEVLGIENPASHMADVLEKALDISLDKKDPKRRLDRRREREAKRAVDKGNAKSRPDKIPHDEERGTSRYIAPEVRDRVQARAGYQCEFRGRNGTRCTSRTGLQIEHERPFAFHHSHDERFLRLFCKAHNRLAAERVYGAAFIQAKVAASRTRSIPLRRANSS